MTLVIDASVAAKWVLAESPVEQDAGKAALLLGRIADENATLLQPEHWRVEVLSIVARLAPDRFDRTWRLLESLNVKWQSSKRVHERAVPLSNQVKHHFFDTLYHAIAIEHDASFITADDAYFAKAFRLGNIQILTNFSAS